MDQAVSHQPSLSETCVSAVFRESGLYTFSIIIAITVRRLDSHSQPAAQPGAWVPGQYGCSSVSRASNDELSPSRAVGCLGILSFCEPGEVGESAAYLAEATTLSVLHADNCHALTKAVLTPIHPLNPGQVVVSCPGFS